MSGTLTTFYETFIARRDCHIDMTPRPPVFYLLLLAIFLAVFGALWTAILVNSSALVVLVPLAGALALLGWSERRRRKQARLRTLLWACGKTSVRSRQRRLLWDD
jgi:hypothetical protein